MAARGPARIGLVCVGTELLRGQPNTHQSWLSRKLQAAGLFVLKECSLPDDRGLIAAELKRLTRECDGIIVCGGLGPTFDDLTREAVADALGRRLGFQPRLFSSIRRKLEAHGIRVVETNKREAMVIQGAEVLPNGVGSAPGQIAFYKRKSGAMGLIALLPGPGSEMEPMFEGRVLPRLRAVLAKSSHARHWVARLCGLPESAADKRLAPITALARAGLDFTILASGGQVSYHVTVVEKTAKEAARVMADVQRRVFAAVGEHVFGEGADVLESVCGDFLRRSRRTLAVAESCTGGLLGGRLTAVAGSSDYFKGGVIAYSNELKRKLLGVSARTLALRGAVSAECASEMARGARRACRADVGVSVTGIAGPGGGTKEKPVGLVYAAVSSGRKTLIKELRLRGGRPAVRERAVSSALALLLAVLRPGKQK